MKRLTCWLLSLAAVAMLASCNDDKTNVPASVHDTFAAMFPRATDVDWEIERGYFVAEFYDAGSDTEAWFDASGKWYLTQIESYFLALPTAVRSAFAAGEYGSWQVDDADRLEHCDLGTLYVLDIERGARELTLCYDAEGNLLHAEPSMRALRAKLLP